MNQARLLPQVLSTCWPPPRYVTSENFPHCEKVSHIIILWYNEFLPAKELSLGFRVFLASMCESMCIQNVSSYVYGHCEQECFKCRSHCNWKIVKKSKRIKKSEKIITFATFYYITIFLFSSIPIFKYN